MERAELVIEYARHRRLDSLSVIVLIFLTVSIVSSLISGSVQFTLLKESAGTALFGLVLLGSLLTPRPLMFHFGRHFATDRRMLAALSAARRSATSS